MANAPQIARFRCPGCSADMQFDPASAAMKCPFCGHEEPLSSQSAILNAHPLDQALTQISAKPLSPQAIESTCDTCGSVVAFEPPEVAGSCPFCGSAIVAQPKAADPLIAPDAVLPAKIPKTAAQAEVRQWLATRWFAPNALQRLAQAEGIGGVYLPFWTYAAATDSQYAGQRGEHYFETESYSESDGQGNTVERSRQVQRTRWYPASGRVSRAFDNVLIPATRAVKESRLDALQPWDLDALRPYEPAYLAGFKAQRYQIELPQGYETAKAVMAAAIEEDVRKDIGGDEQQIDSVQTKYANVTFRHLLLPVWIGAYRFQSKVYQVVVNARTGHVQGERPYSTAKIGFLVAVILMVIFLIFVFSGKS
jgi:Primosomal protein N'' (replication factor Y) - superfamily II helicase